MKRITAILLILATLFCTACSGGQLISTETGDGEVLIRTTGETATRDSGEHNATGFQAGFGREDITPTLSVPLAGYGSTANRLSNHVLDKLYATCVAVRDEEGNTLLIYQLDIINVWTDFGKQARTMISDATGVPYENILLNATHTHSGPDGGSNEGGVGIWKGQAYQAMVAAAKTALADLDRATLAVAATETDRLNFVRRYYLENGFICDNATYGDGAITGHETEVDEEMRLIVFQRENQKDIVLANWQCHPHRTGGSTRYDISSDIIGAMRDKVEKNQGVQFLYLQGGAGNINPTSRISGEVRFGGYQDIGKALAEHLAEGMQNLEEVATGKVRTETMIMQGTVNHADDALAGVAAQISSLWNSGDRASAAGLMGQYGLSSSFEAGAIVTRSNLGETADIEINCYAIGDVAITAAPFEMFCQTEEALREQSPFPFTFTLGYSNSRHGYMPAAEVWDNKGYEVVTCRYVKGTAEQISANQLEMLGRLYADK